MPVSRGLGRRARAQLVRIRRPMAVLAVGLTALVGGLPSTPSYGSSTAPASSRLTGEEALAGQDIGMLRTNLHAGGWRIGRDSGYSATFTSPTGEHAFWIMGDTLIEPAPSWPAGDPHATSDMGPWWRNNTAASGPFTPGTAPSDLVEIGGMGVPHQVIDDPAATAGDTAAGNGVVPCATGVPLYPWAQGVARIPGSNHLLIAYSTLCWAEPTAVVGFGLAQYDPVAQQVVANTPDVFQGDPLDGRFVLQAPVFTSTHVYFSKTCAMPLCSSPQVYVARVALGSSPASGRPWLDPAAYRWWGGAGVGWTSSAGAASIVASPSWSSNMTYQATLAGPDKFVLLEQLDTVGTTLRVSTAPAPEGPWTVRAEGGSGCDTEGGSAVRTCRGFILHAELGSATSVVASFAQAKNGDPIFAKPTDNQVRLLTIPL